MIYKHSDDFSTNVFLTQMTLIRESHRFTIQIINELQLIGVTVQTSQKRSNNSNLLYSRLLVCPIPIIN